MKTKRNRLSDREMNLLEEYLKRSGIVKERPADQWDGDYYIEVAETINGLGELGFYVTAGNVKHALIELLKRGDE